MLLFNVAAAYAKTNFFHSLILTALAMVTVAATDTQVCADYSTWLDLPLV